MSPPDKLSPVVRRLVTDAGTTTQSFGLGRVVGQIYAYLYFSREPRCLSDLERVLGISKGSASTNIRLLEDWGAVQRLWLKGDRRDYFRANTAFGRIIRRALASTVSSTMSLADQLIDEALEDVDSTEHGFVYERLEHLSSFRKKAAALKSNPTLRRLFG